MRFSVLAALAALVAVPASAAEVSLTLSIPVTGAAGVDSKNLAYECDGRTIAVTYLNAGTVSLAVLDIDGETVVAANVVSGSGARYAGGRHVWWSKGDAADLYDLMGEGGEDTPVASCRAAG